MPGRLRQWLGYALTLICLGYIGYIATQIDWSPLTTADASKVIMYTLLGAVGYAILCILTGLTWWQLVIAVSGLQWSSLVAVTIHARTMIYKYLPSNVLHMVGRHIWTREFGIDHAQLTMAVILEIATITSAALLIAVWNHQHLVSLAGTILEYIPAWLIEDGILVWAVIIGLAVGALTLLLARDRLSSFSIIHPMRVLIVFLIYIVFLVFSGCLGYVLLGALGQDLPLGFAIGVLTTAWLCGYVIPGAGGGLGIRELVLIAALAPVCGLEVALLFSLVWRLATLVGELIFSGIAYLLPPVVEKPVS